jgi:tetratricopeptide (TPR) repeat protein
MIFQKRQPPRPLSRPGVDAFGSSGGSPARGVGKRMFGFAWLTLRQAEEALRNGRLEEAQQLLSQSAAQGHRRSGPLLSQLARAYIERGERQLRVDDVEAAWRDLLQAEQLQTSEPGADKLRQNLTRLTVAEVRALVQAGELSRAEIGIGRAKSRGVRAAELDVLDEAVKRWLQARDQAERGEFGAALETYARARRLLPAPLAEAAQLDSFRHNLEQHQQTIAGLLVRLHEATEAARWREVIEIAERVLTLAPHHAEARRVRGQAWKAVQPATVPMQPTLAGPVATSAVGEGGPAPRYLLWIDGIGGYLICLGARLTLGQAVPDCRVDVPLVADVSRLHATLSRDKEGYLLEAVRPIQVNGQQVASALLRSEDRVTLGASCQLVFRQPVPVSLSARLDLVSGHRLPLAVDSVLLMADTLLLGQGPQTHVTIPSLEQPIVLFRQKEALGLRHTGPLTLNGQQSTGRCLLETRTTVHGDDLAFTIEPAGTRFG